MSGSDVIRIANCSGFYGDRLSAARELVEGGPIDVLTGDYLAELTMLILFKDKMGDPKGGFAKTFVKQMEQVMGTCLEKGIKVVVNAGGLNPTGLAEALREVADKLGLKPTLGVVTGDDVTKEITKWQKEGLDLAHLDTGVPLKQAKAMPLAANAYLGCWPIVEALNKGADVVVTGRCTDAAVVMAPAAWKFGWGREDYNALAGALVAGHVIECGTQATGGNYSFFEEVANYHNVGFPIAEIAADGTTVITKHAGTGGAVTVDTVKAQLMYEIQSEEYHSPDVTARFDSFTVTQDGPDRTRISGVLGQAPPDTLKVGVNCAAGYRNSMQFLIGGAEPEKKAKLLEEIFWPLVGGKDNFMETRTDFIKAFHEDPATPNESFSFLRVSARDVDQRKVDRAFGNKAVELALASLPGLSLTGLPDKAQGCGIFWPTLIPRDLVTATVTVGEESFTAEHPPTGGPAATVGAPDLPAAPAPRGSMKRVRLGELTGSRSGDKGGNANVGVWVRKPEHYHWLRDTLTVDLVRQWLSPSGFDGEIIRYELPNLWGMNFILKGFLGQGVGASLQTDPQAKCLGEFFRAKLVDVDEALLEN